MMAGARIEASQDKEHPMDFTLWKASKPGEPSWESPWGAGRPGWHIECSAMSLKYLGGTLDIHGGGQDLIFPHHENEIAQSESFTGKKPFVRYWLHNGLLQFGEDKMSKSLGNLITIKEALDKYSSDAIRIFVLSSHYHSPLTYSEVAIEAAEGGAERLMRASSLGDDTAGSAQALDAEPYQKQFIKAMDDDFNTPQALAVLFDLARAINQAGNSGINFRQAQKTLTQLAQDVLGLRLDIYIIVSPITVKTSVIASTVSTVDKSTQVELRVNRLVEERVNCRKEENWQRADEIRAELVQLGIILEDTPEGTKIIWKRKR
jgi:cysteinyl-tRNA synthetase